MKALVILILVSLAGLGIWYYQGDAGDGAAEMTGSSAATVGPRRAERPELVTVKPVAYREFTDTIESIGTTKANESVVITSKVTDTVSKVHFEDGDFVEAGSILVEMTNQEESALLAEAQANLDEARRQLRRQLDLGERGLTAKSSIDEAVARTEAAEARFDAITARMNDRLIRAPFSGLLGFREISPGSLLSSNTPITTLDDISVIKLDFSVPEVYLGRIRTGYRIEARSDAWEGRVFEGVITSVGSRIDPVTRAVTVRARIENKDRLLRPGMLMTVQVLTDTRQAMVIPESAFIQTGDETYVYIAGEDGLVHRQAIQVGARRFGYVEVTEGLQPGDTIITEGAFKLRDKAPYRTKNRAEAGLQISAEKDSMPWAGS